MDTILITNMAFYGFHGALAEEATLGQRFFIDLELGIDLQPAGLSDDLAKTVSYEQVYQLTRELTEGSRYRLIEALAEAILARLFARYPQLLRIVITVRKPEAPVNGIFDHVGVRLERTRP